MFRNCLQVSEYGLHSNAHAGVSVQDDRATAVEVVVDEMIAILSDREQLIKKKESEHAQAVISEIYREGL